MSLSLTSVLVVLLRSVGVIFQALIVVVLVNSISVEEMGLFSAVYIFWGLTRALGPLGLDQVSMRDIATFADTDGSRAQAVSNYAFRSVGLIGLALALVTAMLLFAFTGGGTSHYTLPAVLAAALGAPAYAMNGLLVAQLRGFGKTIHSQVSEAITLHVVSLALMALLASRGELTLEYALLIQSGAAWLVMVIYAGLRLRCGIEVGARLTDDLRRSTRKDAFEIWGAQCLGSLNERVPVYISLAMLGPAGAAIIDIAKRFGGLPTIVTDGVATTFAPVFAQLHANAGKQDYRDALTLGSWLAFLPSLSVLGGMLVLGPWLLSAFFPPDYQQAFWPMVLICAATAINAAFGLASTTFLVVGRQSLVRRYTAYSLAVVSLGGVVLGWFFGPVGIAAAICIGVILRDGGLARILVKDLGGPVMLDPRLPKRIVRTVMATAR